MTDEAMSPLRRRMIEDMTIRKFAPKTQHDYVQRVKNFAAFLRRSPDTASFEDVRRYQLHLAASGVGVPTLKIADKETRPPPRYNEGTLIEAMQNAWRFVDDEVLRDRLKEAKGIGTPATRAEIIGGLKKQSFLIAEGKNIVPTETGLLLFGVLKQADPALVDPGVTAQLECLLDDVVVGKQEMVGAIDAVCDVAERIINELKDGATAGGPSLLGSAGSNGTGTYPPTPAMKRFADSLVRQKGIKP